MNEILWLIFWVITCAVFSYAMKIQRRNTLLNLRYELGKLKWMGADDGWDAAIEAVRKHCLEESKKVPNHWRNKS